MLYTTIPLARSQSTSQVFLDHDIQNAAPATVSDLRISIVTTIYDPIVAWFTSLLWMIIGVWYTETPLKIGKTTNIMGNRSSSSLFSPPPLVVSFPSKVSEETLAKLTDMGFVIQTKGNYKYYKGPASEENVHTLVALGAQADAYAEYGSCNVNGFLSFLVIDSIINGALAFLENATTLAKKIKNSVGTDEILKYSTAWPGKVTFITSKDELPEKGILFPYFAGLVLPDKAMPVRFLVDNFHRALGNTPAEILRNTGILLEGWSSLSTSTSGCAISHLIFGISLAYSGSVNLQALYLNGQYSGFVLSAAGGFAVMNGKTCVKPIDRDALGAELDALNKHDTALSAIATILSSIELRVPTTTTVTNDGVETSVEVKVRTCSQKSLDTPRKLYNAISRRKLTPENVKNVQKEVLKLEYRQTFWPVTDQSKVALAATLICSGGQPPEEAPMAYKTSALYNLDPIASVLSAFGPVAPTLVGNENGNGLIPLTTSGKMYEETKGFTLRGCPIFVVSLQRAVEDWNTVLRNGLIRLKHAGNDKGGFAKISGKYTYVPKGSKPYEHITGALKGIAKRIAEQGKKRKLEDKADDPVKEEERLAKKAKRDDTMLAILGETERPMDVDTLLDF